MSHYIHYYNDQVGGGAGVKSVYTGATYQRGPGIGSFLGSIFRRIAPYLARGAKAVGKEAVRAGLNVIDDVTNNGANFKEALSGRLKDAYLYYKPISSLSDDGDSPLEFLIPSSTDHYIDLAHTTLHLTVQILPASDTPSENLKVGPVNNFIHSIAYIETLLNYATPAMRSHLTSALWSIDTADAMDAAPNLDRKADGANQGLINRLFFIAGGKAVDMIGHLHCDVFNQPKFLTNGLDVRVRLVLSKDAFCLMDLSDKGKFSVHIKEATLIVRRAKISPGILLAHANALAKTTAKYPLTRADVNSFTLHSGILGDTLDNVILGQLPKRIILGFVKNKAFNVNRKLNPLNFQHFNINFISLYMDGVQVPSIHYLNEGLDIDRYGYPNVFCLFAFNLTPDLSAHFISHWNLVRSGSLCVEVRFAEALTETLNCIVYAEFDNVLEIDSNRQIITDFNS
ncbi:uncharacterized protein F54H12.2-like [Nasonia vitripennis]|uniref:Uncharacterized protein n=1 Tax=Nasonia vitripennis TaxID=7425 RepID=A0A7M7PYY8_NASVI|nr:uncharacterized protein F54H12.2-like [Nasonia vitripennis]